MIHSRTGRGAVETGLAFLGTTACGALGVSTGGSRTHHGFPHYAEDVHVIDHRYGAFQGEAIQRIHADG